MPFGSFNAPGQRTRVQHVNFATDCLIFLGQRNSCFLHKTKFFRSGMLDRQQSIESKAESVLYRSCILKLYPVVRIVYWKVVEFFETSKFEPLKPTAGGRIQWRIHFLLPIHFSRFLVFTIRSMVFFPVFAEWSICALVRRLDSINRFNQSLIESHRFSVVNLIF